ncbi:unnamed protein product [Rotaria magnacalcarata]|uniref:Uncharacterized protein n=2 Tax=Rotaria magnacalcarata TaxID=392030 RepID=A0A814Z599_9BILA|nr:unnamed protein product [Rotaria magnacalcarata]CAF1903636.1 unnamed protein product [Rotaria magnacalcarata]
MKLLIVVLVFTLFSYASGQLCNSNPCQLDATYKPTAGYQCIEHSTEAICTCPIGHEVNRPCRSCSRSNPANNICQNGTGRLIMCLDTTDFGSTYACLCLDPRTNQEAVTLDPNCDLSVTETTTKPTTPSLNCQNGGVSANGICNCPSGTSGSFCEVEDNKKLCERIICKNLGACAIRANSGGYHSVCLCRAGYSGEYCELTATPGFCTPTSCQNNGACREEVIGATRNAYCYCQAGYSGTKCENRHFTCTKAGKFSDSNMSDHGKYFECTQVGVGFRIEQKSCPEGLRFSTFSGLCTY